MEQEQEQSESRSMALDPVQPERVGNKRSQFTPVSYRHANYCCTSTP